MLNKLLSIELGRKICKVCVSTKKGKGYEITDTFAFVTPKDSVVEGQVVDVVNVAAELQAELENRSINIEDVIFTISSSKIATREITVPAVKPEQIRTIVQTNASEYFPVDVSTYKIDAIIESTNKEKSESKVIVVAVPTSIIESYIHLANAAGLKIEALDIVSNSQFNILKSIPVEGVTMYITCEPDSASVLFIEDGRLLLQRSIMIGADELIQTYMENANLNEHEYLKALEDAKAETFGEDDASARRALNMLISGLSRSQDFFRAGKNADKEINRVVLMGSCAHINGLKAGISESLGVEAFYLEELEQMQKFANAIDNLSLNIGCVGARLSPLNILPKEYLQQIGHNNANIRALREKYGYLVAALSVSMSIILVLSVMFPYLTATKELKSVEAQIAEIAYSEEEYNAYIRYKQGDEALQAYVDKANNKNANLVTFFEELERKMPKNLSLLSATCTNEGVSISITVTSFEEAAMVLRQFRTFESIDVISSSGLSKSEDTVPTVSFSLTCTYANDPVPVDIPVAEEEPAAEENVEG